MGSWFLGGNRLRQQARCEVSGDARRALRNFVFFTLIASAALATGCVKSLGKARKYSTLDASYLNSQTTTLTQVIRNKNSPTTVLDLGGDGTGALGKNCTRLPNVSTSTADGYGPSTCQCHFRYITANGELTLDADTTYREGDLIRCPYTGIPQDLAQVQVSVRYAGGESSNEVTFNMGSGSGYASNPTEVASFVPVLRYQCTDIVSVFHSFWGSVYDRDQSEDPRLTTPMNFYTTNLGQTLALYAAGYKSVKAPSGWDCPANPLDPKIQYVRESTPLPLSFNGGLLTLALQPDFKAPANQLLLARYDMRIFAEDGSAPLYPPTSTGGKNPEFLVAREPTGIFRVPVNAIVAPGINTDPAGQVGPPPIGYGAFSIPTASGTETCPKTAEEDPSGIPLPAGYKFAKLWLFRSSFYGRTFHTANKFDNWAIACNPQAGWSDNATKPVFAQPGCTATLKTPSNGYASRLSSGETDCKNANNGAFWTPEATQAQCLDGGSACGTGAQQGTTRSDYLYIVSPTTIMSKDIENATPAGLPYIPRRPLSSLDCRVSGNWTNGACDNARMAPPYHALRNRDIGESYDRYADQSGVDFKFPLCVLVKK